MPRIDLILLRAVTLLFLSISTNAQAQNCPGSEAVTVQLQGHVKGKLVTKQMAAQKIDDAVLLEAGMAIDVDGAPNAYGPNNKGLDYTQNAKNGQKWAGVAVDKAGNPVTQQSGPYKGFYVSVTSLHATGQPVDDPSTYVDASNIPYIALPPDLVKQFGIQLGDMAVVMTRNTRAPAYAIYADVGPHLEIGEGSLALARTLGFSKDQLSPRRGGVDTGIRYLIFPASGLGQGKLRTLDEITREATERYTKWGGDTRLRACSVPVINSGTVRRGH